MKINLTICGVRELPDQKGKHWTHVISIWDKDYLYDPACRELVTAVTPPTCQADDLFRTASRHKWDFGFLLLNNIDYGLGNRESRAIANDSIDFVMKMALVFEKPLFALHGLDEGLLYHARLQEAGAAAVYRMPFALDDMAQAVKKCSGISDL